MTHQTKTDNPFFVRVTSPKSISKDSVSVLYRHLVKQMPSGIAISVPVVKPDQGVEPVILIHRTLTSGSHVYEIPLSRNLTTEEFSLVEEDFKHQFIDELVLDASAAQVEDARQWPTVETNFEPELYDIFCDTLAKRQHAHWCDSKVAEGWRYGTTYDAASRVSPLLRPWQDLPEQYKQVDKSFPQEIISIMEDLGMVIVPRDSLMELLKSK